MLFHVTLSQGRSDSIYLESSTKSKVLTFLQSVSTAVVRNIKEVVYSKDFNINYVQKPYVASDSWYKVIFVAESKNYAQTFTFFNIKKSVSPDVFEQQFKKLFIKNEPILSIFDIQYFNSPELDSDFENLFQIQYKRNSKTYIENLYCPSWDIAKEFAETLIDGELTEIRKFVHHDSTLKKDDYDYYKRVTFFLFDSDAKMSFVLPKIKKTLEPNQLKDFIKNSLTFKSKNIDSDKINLTFR